MQRGPTLSEIRREHCQDLGLSRCDFASLARLSLLSTRVSLFKKSVETLLMTFCHVYLFKSKKPFAYLGKRKQIISGSLHYILRTSITASDATG